MISRRQFMMSAVAFGVAPLLPVWPTAAWSNTPKGKPPVELRRVADGVYMHISWIPYGDHFGPSNGLIILGKDEALIVDTPVSIPETEELLKKIIGYDRKLLALTHSHGDRIAGFASIKAHTIPSLAHDMTARLAAARNAGVMDQVWYSDIKHITVGGRKIELFYPGPAHAPDNTVLYIEDCQVLYGACMVRALRFDNLGGLGSADLCRWPQSIRNLQQRYKKARIVVPGHGDFGGPELLTHTLQLAEAAAVGQNCTV